MAQNYSQAYGYNFYFAPLLATAVDLTDLDLGGLGSGKFLNPTTLLSNDAAVTKTGTGNSLNITVGGTSLDLDGTDSPIRLLGLTNAAPSETEKEETIQTYDDEAKSFETSIATGKGFSWTLEGVTDHMDAAYQLLRICSKESVREKLMIKWARIGPTGFNEVTYGFGRFTGFNETPPAGGIVKWSSNVKCYGPYELELAND